MKEITCPYCEYEYDLNHDDGAFYNTDGELEKEECPECNKTFMVESSMSWDFEAHEADCQNGGDHDWQQQTGAPREHFIGRFTCTLCGEEEHRDEEGRKKAMEEYLNKLKS